MRGGLEGGEGGVIVAKPIQADMLCSNRCHHAIIGIVMVALVVVVSFVLLPTYVIMLCKR